MSIAEKEPRRYGENGELLIEYEEMEVLLARRRSGVVDGKEDGGKEKGKGMEQGVSVRERAGGSVGGGSLY